MGAACTISTDMRYAPPMVPPELVAAWGRLYDELQLSEENRRKLEAEFQKIRRRSGIEPPEGFVAVEDLFAYCGGLEQSALTEKMFNCIVDWREGYGELLATPDVDLPGTHRMLDFTRWLVFTWNLCTLDRSAMAVLLFNIYDEKGEGEVARDVLLKTLIEDIFGDRISVRKRRDRVTKVVAEHPVIKLTRMERKILRGEFIEVVSSTPGLTFMVEEMKFLFRQKIVGVKFWEKLERERQLFDGSASYEEFKSRLRRLGLDVLADPKDEDRLKAGEGASALRPEDKAFAEHRKTLHGAESLRRIRKEQRRLDKIEGRRRQSETAPEVSALAEFRRAEIKRRKSSTGSPGVDAADHSAEAAAHQPQRRFAAKAKRKAASTHSSRRRSSGRRVAPSPGLAGTL